VEKITVEYEIECDKETCGKCKYGKILDNCIIFNFQKREAVENDYKRLPECIAACKLPMYLTYRGRFLIDYHCPKCGNKELKGEHEDNFVTCINCGKIPLKELDLQWGKEGAK